MYIGNNLIQKLYLEATEINKMYFSDGNSNVSLIWGKEVDRTIAFDDFTGDEGLPLTVDKLGNPYIQSVDNVFVHEGGMAKSVQAGPKVFAVNSGINNCIVSADGYYSSYISLHVRSSLNPIYNSKNKNYRLRLNSSSFGLFRILGTSPTALGAYAITPEVGRIYNLKVVLDGSTIMCYLDGILRITATDDTAGWIENTAHGIYIDGMTNKIDNFRIERLV